MNIEYKSGQFICRCSFEERGLPKDAGFFWDPLNKIWYTTHYGSAARLEAYLNDEARTILSKKRLRIDSWTGPLSVPRTEKLLPFQETAVRFALSRNRSYLALDPGLGKTPIAAVTAATLNHFKPIAGIYICPPFLALNTEAEFSKWAPELPIAPFKSGKHSWFMVLPDSILHREVIQDEIRKFTKQVKSMGYHTVLFVDEAHKFKNDSASRTASLFGPKDRPGGLAALFDRVVYLSGTPMPNRPIELFPVLSHSAPQTIDYMNRFEYGVKYCAAFENKWGWDFSGASNIDELAKNVLGSFMLRYKKKEVLKDLPPKTEEMVLLDGTLTPRLAKMSHVILEKFSPEDLMKNQIQLYLETDTLHLATYRRELGVIKAKNAARYIEYLLTEYEDESILVFAIHKEVVAILKQELSDHSPLVVTGDTRMELRNAMVQEFQSHPKRRLFIGNIQAAGTGFTLTKATRVVFVEFSWVPADNDQASDRAHRIGQSENVLVQYLVYKNSVDKAVIETVLRKKKVTEKL